MEMTAPISPQMIRRTTGDATTPKPWSRTAKRGAGRSNTPTSHASAAECRRSAGRDAGFGRAILLQLRAGLGRRRRGLGAVAPEEPAQRPEDHEPQGRSHGNQQAPERAHQAEPG